MAAVSSFRQQYLKARYRFSLKQVIAELLAKKWMEALVPFVVMAFVIFAISARITGYWSAENVTATGREFGEFAFLALAMLVVVVAGGIDLSIGAIFAL